MKSVQFEDYSFLVPGQSERVTLTGFLATRESLHITGPSGVGKTTMLRAIAGLLDGSEQGSFRLGGRECVGQASENRSLAVVFQGFQLFAHLTVVENLLVAFERRDSLRWLSPDLKRARIETILEKVNLKDKMLRHASELSGGEHQRVAICRALLSESSVVLFDEPFSALDSQSKDKAKELMVTYQKEQQATFLLVSHRREDFWRDGVKELLWKDGQTWLEF